MQYNLKDLNLFLEESNKEKETEQWSAITNTKQRNC